MKRVPPGAMAPGPAAGEGAGLLLTGLRPGPLGPEDADTLLEEDDDDDVLVEDTTATAGVVKRGLKLMEEWAGGAPLAAGCWMDAEKDCCGPCRVVTVDLQHKDTDKVKVDVEVLWLAGQRGWVGGWGGMRWGAG